MSKQREKVEKRTKSHTKLPRIISIFIFAGNGIWQALKTEVAFRQELALLVAGCVVAFYFDFGYIDRIILIASLLFVLVIELVNTAIELVVDRVGTEYHELSKLAKDTASATVAVSLSLALFCWLMILWAKFGHLLPI